MSKTKNKVAERAKPTDIISHWPKLIENLKFSPQEFYARVEQALADRQVPDLEVSRVDWKEGGLLSARREYLRLKRERLVFDVCGAPFGTGFFVSIWFGEKRLRLSVILLIVALFLPVRIMIWLQTTPVYGNGPSFWQAHAGETVLIAGAMCVLLFVAMAAFLGRRFDNFLIRVPLIGYFYERLFRNITLYRIDQTCMYQQAVHAAVMQVIDEITTAEGIQRLSDLDRRPVMRELFQRQGSNGKH